MKTSVWSIMLPLIWYPRVLFDYRKRILKGALSLFLVKKLFLQCPSKDFLIGNQHLSFIFSVLSELQSLHIFVMETNLLLTFWMFILMEFNPRYGTQVTHKYYSGYYGTLRLSSATICSKDEVAFKKYIKTCLKI